MHESRLIPVDRRTVKVSRAHRCSGLPALTPPLFSRRGIEALLLVAIGLCAVPTFADEKRKEDQSAFRTADGQMISSSALIKLLKEKLDTRYQDLELVVAACESGEFASRAAAKEGGLGGNWSVTTASSSSRCATDTQVAGNQKRKGQDGSDVFGLPIKTPYYMHGFSAQYSKRLLEGKNDVGNKALFEYARDKNHMDSGPQYASSGATADNTTLHGGKKSNHAIVFSSNPTDYADAVTSELLRGLRAVGYDEKKDLQFLSGKMQATQKGLEAALEKMRAALDQNPNEEKAYLYISAHGNYDERTVAYADGKLDQAGGGVTINSINRRISIFADNPVLWDGLKEELPSAGGGYWADDPLLQRGGPTYLSFTTFSEFFAGPTLVQVLIDGLPAGVVSMGNPLGADYQIDLSDALVDQLLPELMSSGALDIDFLLPGDADHVQLAGFQDYLDAGFTPLGYGIGIGTPLSSTETVAEPGTLALMSTTLCCLLIRIGRRRRLGDAPG